MVQWLRTEAGDPGECPRTGRRAAGALFLGLSLMVLGVSCEGTETQEPTAGTKPPMTLAAPPGEQVCRLLSDDEVKVSLAVDTAAHSPTVSTPRSCTWAARGDPSQPLVQLALASQQWVNLPPGGDGIGAPCAQGGTLARTILGPGDALHARCLVDGLAVFLTARSTGRSEVIGLLRLAVARLGSIDRAAFGFDPKPEAGGTSTVSRRSGAPPECVDAWRTGRLAPTHCEEYPEAYRAILRGD